MQPPYQLAGIPANCFRIVLRPAFGNIAFHQPQRFLACIGKNNFLCAAAPAFKPKVARTGK